MVLNGGYLTEGGLLAWLHSNNEHHGLLHTNPAIREHSKSSAKMVHLSTWSKFAEFYKENS